MEKINYPKKVKIVELLLRDGIQNERKTMLTKAKLFFAKQFTEIGFQEIEIGSFAHPKYIPQHNDIEKLLKSFYELKFEKRPLLKAFTTTLKAVERAVKTKKEGYGPDKIAFVIAASEPHNIVNINRDWKTFFKEIPKFIGLAKDNNIEIYAEFTATFGCPITKKKVPFENSYFLIDKLLPMGIDGIIPCDTTGEATPNMVYKYYSELRKRYSSQNVHWAHFHNNRGIANTNCFAAIQAGVTNLEASLGGIGGQPAFIVNGVPGLGTGRSYTESSFNGNAPTEDLVVMLEGMGINTGLSVEKLLETGNILEDVLERTLHSYSIKTGSFYK